MNVLMIDHRCHFVHVHVAGAEMTHANASCCKRRTRFRYNTKVDICYSSVGSTSRDLSSTALYNLGTGR